MMTFNRLLLLTMLFTLPSLASTAERVVPTLPPVGEKIPVIIDTDAACEIDDLYAIALALVSQERFDIKGFVGAHFGDAGGPDGIDKSVQAIHTIMEKAGMESRFPVKKGSPPFRYSQQYEESEGVDFIIEQAQRHSPENPLWVVLLGPSTDIVCAYMKEPSIQDRVIAFWHGRTQWPLKCWNFNAYNDLKAVRLLFKSPLPLVLFDTGTYLRCPMDESKEHIYPHGPLGKYLHNFRHKSQWYQSPRKGFFDLGDIAALLDPSLTEWEVVDVPEVEWDMDYVHNHKHGKMLRIYHVDRDRTFQRFYQQLKEAN